MIRRTGIVWTVDYSREVLSAELKRIKMYIAKYLVDPKVCSISVSSGHLPDCLVVLLPEGKHPVTDKILKSPTVEFIPHVQSLTIPEFFDDFSTEVILDWKLHVLEKFTEEWFEVRYGDQMKMATDLIQRSKFGKKPEDKSKTDFSTAKQANPIPLRMPYWDDSVNHLISSIIPGPDGILQAQISTPEPTPTPPSEPFFFTDVKQMKRKKEKPAKAKKSKSK